MNLRPTTLYSYSRYIKRLKQEWGERPVAGITRVEMRQAIYQWSRDYAEMVQTFMRWAYVEDLAPHDICRSLIQRSRRSADREVSFLSPAEAQGVVAAACEEFRPALALAMYAGMRTYEICRMRWGDIHIKHRRIVVQASVSKIRRKRILEDLPSVLWATLQRSAKTSGDVIARYGSGEINTSRWIALRRECARRACVPLPHNVFRHSFATYFTALTGNPARTAKILGHHGLQLLASNYDGVATREMAEQYFHPRPILGLPYYP